MTLERHHAGDRAAARPAGAARRRDRHRRRAQQPGGARRRQPGDVILEVNRQPVANVQPGHPRAAERGGGIAGVPGRLPRRAGSVRDDEEAMNSGFGGLGSWDSGTKSLAISGSPAIFVRARGASESRARAPEATPSPEPGSSPKCPSAPHPRPHSRTRTDHGGRVHGARALSSRARLLPSAGRRSGRDG